VLWVSLCDWSSYVVHQHFHIFNFSPEIVQLTFTMPSEDFPFSQVPGFDLTGAWTLSTGGRCVKS